MEWNKSCLTIAMLLTCHREAPAQISTTPSLSQSHQVPPATTNSAATTSTAVGSIEWDVTDRAGVRLAHGRKKVGASEIRTISNTYQRLDLDKDYYLSVPDPIHSRQPPSMIALVAGRNGEERFSYEMFNLNGTRATRRQEKGDLQVQVDVTGKSYQVTRTHFLTDVSIRMYKEGSNASLVFNNPEWRLNIRKGSDIYWPLVPDTLTTRSTARPWLGTRPRPRRGDRVTSRP